MTNASSEQCFRLQQPVSRLYYFLTRKGNGNAVVNGNVGLVWFFVPGLHNVCGMKWNQGCYQAREVFLETHSFTYVLQALSVVLFIRKGHSVASMLFPFSLSWPKYQAHCSVGSPFNSHHNSTPFLVVVVVSARSFFPQERFCQRY